jgi:hypothetical protein
MSGLQHFQSILLKNRQAIESCARNVWKYGG